MSKQAREAAREHGQRSGKGTQTVSRTVSWVKTKLGIDEDDLADAVDNGPVREEK